MADSKQHKAEPRENRQGPPPFSLGPLGSLTQVIKALSKTIRAMADDTISSEKGARICNVKRLTAIEDRMEVRQPLYRWLDVYASEAEIERQRAEAKAEADASGRKLVLLSWQRTS